MLVLLEAERAALFLWHKSPWSCNKKYFGLEGKVVACGSQVSINWIPAQSGIANVPLGHVLIQSSLAVCMLGVSDTVYVYIWNKVAFGSTTWRKSIKLKLWGMYFPPISGSHISFRVLKQYVSLFILFTATAKLLLSLFISMALVSAIIGLNTVLWKVDLTLVHLWGHKGTVSMTLDEIWCNRRWASS